MLGQVGDGALGCLLIRHAHCFSQQTRDDRRGEGRAAYHRITLRWVGSRHVGSRRGELHLPSTTRLKQRALVRINCSNTHNVRIRRRVKRRSRRAIVTNGRNNDMPTRNNHAYDILKHHVRRPYETHVYDSDPLSHQPRKGIRHRIDRATRRKSAIDIRRVKLRPRCRAMKPR
jgi:hypothetical protein